MADCSDCDDLSFTDNLENSLDEVDCAKLIEIIDDCEIPLKFQRTQSKCVSERATEYRLVNNGWGTKLSLLSDAMGTYAIITVNSPFKTASDVEKFVKELKRASKVRLDPLRWSPQHLFVYLSTEDNYEELGKALLDGHLDHGGYGIVDSLEPAMHYNPPHAFVEIAGQDCEEIYSVISPLVLPFSGCFTYLRLRHPSPDNPRRSTTPAGAALPVEHHPSVCIGLLFDGKHQSLALKSLAKISANGWEPVKLSDAVTKILDLGLEYFSHKKINLPLLSVKTAAPNAGVQITIFVRDLNKFDKMLDFYRDLVRGEPVLRNVPEIEFRSSTLALSRTAELILAYYPGLAVVPCKNATVYIKVASRSDVPALEISKGFWETFDPEGNRVVLFEMIK